MINGQQFLLLFTTDGGCPKARRPMAFAPGRPGAKKTKEEAAKDKNFAEQKLRFLERAEKNLAKVCTFIRVTLV